MSHICKPIQPLFAIPEKNHYTWPSLFVLFCCLVQGPAQGDLPTTPVVLTSIRPLEFLVNDIMAPYGRAHLIIPPGQSAHHYQLQPRAAQLLSQAQLIFWIGPSYEFSLNKALSHLSPSIAIKTLMDTPGLPLWPKRQKAPWASTHQHNHGSAESLMDPHIWLDPLIVIQLIGEITRALSVLDPLHAAHYEENARALKQKILALHHSLEQQLSAYAGTPFLVFHDGFQYFEKRYGLTAQGSVVFDPEIPLSAKRLKSLNTQLQEKKIRCILSEPEFQDLPMTPLKEDIPRLHIQEVDSLGARLNNRHESDPEALYVRMMQEIGQKMSACLSENNM